MRLSIIGTGYVGLVTGACLADVGNEVLCVDTDAQKIDRLRQGDIPLHEPGLPELVRRHLATGRLGFTTDARAGAAFGPMQFIAVGTPADDDGAADLRQVLAAAATLGEHMTEERLVVVKSTVPVGTTARVRRLIAGTLLRRGLPTALVRVAANPEFLKEGAAVVDFMRPDRIIVGADDPLAAKTLRALYAPFQQRRQRDRLVVMDTRSAEFTKYASNAMLATRISFMNEMALLAEKLGADIEQVRRGMGTDPRIGGQYLHAGCGFGGSCFAKDLKALRQVADGVGEPLKLLTAVEAVNTRQKQVLAERIVARFGEDLTGRVFAIWGLAFKPDTDDLREAPSRTLIAELLARGAQVVAHDPEAMSAARQVFAEVPMQRLRFAATPMQATEEADALVLVTEWRAYRSPDLEQLADRLRARVVFDGRNLFDPDRLRQAGLEHVAIGRPVERPVAGELLQGPPRQAEARQAVVP